MKEHHNINFNLFCQRKGFSLEKWIASNPGTSYEDLRASLLKIKVMPPDPLLFEEIKTKHSELKIEKVVEKKVAQKKPVRKTRGRKRKVKTNED